MGLHRRRAELIDSRLTYVDSVPGLRCGNAPSPGRMRDEVAGGGSEGGLIQSSLIQLFCTHHSSPFLSITRPRHGYRGAAASPHDISPHVTTDAAQRLASFSLYCGPASPRPCTLHAADGDKACAGSRARCAESSATAVSPLQTVCEAVLQRPVTDALHHAFRLTLLVFSRIMRRCHAWPRPVSQPTAMHEPGPLSARQIQGTHDFANGRQGAGI